MIILKGTKKQGFFLSLENIFLGKAVGVSNGKPIPSLFRIKRPSNLIARVLFWSNDKNNNRMK